MLTPDSGDVYIQGVTPRALINDSPGLIAYVPQNPGMVSGTVAENVALGVEAQHIEADRVWDALERASLADFVRGLRSGIDSDLGKHANSLSGGQKQRLGIARALYGNPSLLVLDEATSALDAETEAGIARTIVALRGTVTVLVIAHRLSTIQHADTVHVVEHGSILASGKFTEVRKSVPLVDKYVELMAIEETP